MQSTSQIQDVKVPHFVCDWGSGPIGTVGEPAGNATAGYYSGSATVVDGQPRIIVPAVWGSDHPSAGGTGPGGGGNCNWESMSSKCVMTYVQSVPVDLASTPF